MLFRYLLMHRNFYLYKKNKIKFVTGFSLIELLVSISIIVLVLGVIMVRQSSFNGAVLLRSQAYEVALQIREIQLSALSAVGESGEFQNVLGLHFDTATPNYYWSFRDVDADSYYDSDESIGKRNNLDKRFEISAIRLIGDVSVPTNLSIVFRRPNFDANFYVGSGTAVSSAVSAIEIDVRLKGTTGTGPGEVRTVEISRTGQITVQSI